MGIHAFITGTALGVLNSMANFIGLLVAIVAHKWAEAIAVGISFVRNKVSHLKTVIGLVIFSLLTPLGILLGMFVTSSPLGEAIMLSISAGTFLYIAVAEIISAEFAKSDMPKTKFLCYTFGALLMVGVWFLEQLFPDDG